MDELEWTVDEFEVIRNIRDGPNGTIQLWKNRMDNFFVSARFFDVVDDLRIAEFVAEMNVQATLDHPHLEKLVGYVLPKKEGDALIILHGFCETIPFSTPLDATSKSKVVLGVAKAVEYLHAMEFVGLGLKPSNLRLGAVTKEPIVVDFGISRVLPLGVSSLPPSESPHDSPEVRAGERPTKASDVFSLCSMIFELATGVPPVRGGGAPGLREIVPVSVAVVLEAGLEDAPDGGRPTVDDVLHACEDARWLLFEGADEGKIAEMLEVMPVGGCVTQRSLVLAVAKFQREVT
jgi:serine/threonine protein kinase